MAQEEKNKESQVVPNAQAMPIQKKKKQTMCCSFCIGVGVGPLISCSSMVSTVWSGWTLKATPLCCLSNNLHPVGIYVQYHSLGIDLYCIVLS
jgi:hypothetical protein